MFVDVKINVIVQMKQAVAILLSLIVIAAPFFVLAEFTLLVWIVIGFSAVFWLVMGLLLQQFETGEIIDGRLEQDESVIVIKAGLGLFLFIGYANLSVVLAHRQDWVLIKNISGQISNSLAGVIPALGGLQEWGASERAAVILDVTATGYFWSLLFAAFVLANPGSLFTKFFKLCADQSPKDPSAQKLSHVIGRALLFVLALGYSCWMLLYVDMSRDGPSAEAFGDIRTSDASLVYRMWFEPLFIFGATSIAIRVLIDWIRGVNARIASEE